MTLLPHNMDQSEPVVPVHPVRPVRGGTDRGEHGRTEHCTECPHGHLHKYVRTVTKQHPPQQRVRLLISCCLHQFLVVGSRCAANRIDGVLSCNMLAIEGTNVGGNVNVHPGQL